MKANLLPTHSALLFTWEGNIGITERSDFGPGEFESRVWSDACDVGFKVRSPRTGRVLTFVHSHLVHCDEDVTESIYRALERPEIEVHVLND